MVQNVIFDVGNVLLRFAPREWLRGLLQEEAAADVILRAVVGGTEWALLDEGAITEDEALARMTAKLPQHAAQIKQAFARWPECLSPVPGMHELVARCREKGYGVYVLSNFSQRFYTIAPQYPIFAQMDGLLISSTERLVKPQSAIYARLCEKFALSPEGCFFLDDLPANIEAARAFGMDGAVFTGYDALPAWLRAL